MFQRQKVLLHLIDRAGGRLDKLRLMKIFFLARQEGHLSAQTALYGFVPYHHGPFSFTMYRDIAKLSEEQELLEDKATLALRSRDDLPILEAASRGGVDAVWDRHGSWASERLISHVYGQHPWFTVNAKDPSKRLCSRPIAEQGIYTIGYEKLPFEDFLDRLLRCGIRRVVDVRANPVARRYGFHRSTLDRNVKRMDMYPSWASQGKSGRSSQRWRITIGSSHATSRRRCQGETRHRPRRCIAQRKTDRAAVHGGGSGTAPPQSPRPRRRR